MPWFIIVLAFSLLHWSPMSAMAQSSKLLAVSTSKNIRLPRSGPTQIRLIDGTTQFISPLPTPVGDTQTYLVLKDIFAESPPGVGYDVYLDVPSGTAPGGRGDVHYLGTFHFFDTSPGHPREVRLNITQKLKALAANAQLSSTPSVTIVPGATARAESQIGSIAIETE